MKKEILLITALVLPACTTVRKDDHSYTYIHNYNNNSQEESAKVNKPKNSRKDADMDQYPSEEDYPSPKARRTTANDDQQFLQYVQQDAERKEPQQKQNNVTHNHYYAGNTTPRPTYEVPNGYTPQYGGFNPAVRKFLVFGDLR